MDVLASWIDALAPDLRVSVSCHRLGTVHTVALDGDSLINVAHQSGERPRVMMFSSPGCMLETRWDGVAPADMVEIDGSCWSVAVDPSDAAVLLRWSFDASTLDEDDFHGRFMRFANCHLAWADLIEAAADGSAFDDAADSMGELLFGLHAQRA